jgi:hypothetical protein
MNVLTPKVATKHELLLNKLATGNPEVGLR